MKLMAISDLHLANPINREAMASLPEAPEDWLILAGDIAERPDHLRDFFALAAARFARVIWVPGNHELWTVTEGGADGGALAGAAKYRALVDLARDHGVTTPEDEYPLWTGPGGPCVVAPLFLLYDYSFRPDDLPRDRVIPWAREGGAVCADEMLLNPAPYPTREAWCQARCDDAEARLVALDGAPTVLVNHYPLRRDLVHIPRIPRFSPWCGTRRTEDWHIRFNAKVAVSGHLHVRRTDWIDGTRFEEVSLGYPRQWDRRRGILPYIREILPGPAAP